MLRTLWLYPVRTTFLSKDLHLPIELVRVVLEYDSDFFLQRERSVQGIHHDYEAIEDDVLAGEAVFRFHGDPPFRSLGGDGVIFHHLRLNRNHRLKK